MEEAKQASRTNVTSVHRRVQQFNKQQADIDRRLLIFTRSETSDEAIRQFEKTMNKLRDFDVATGYLELLKTVDKLQLVENNVSSGVIIRKGPLMNDARQGRSINKTKVIG